MVRHKDIITAIYPEDDQAESAEATSQRERGRSVVLQFPRSLNKTMDVMNPVEFLPGTHRALRKSLQRAWKADAELFHGHPVLGERDVRAGFGAVVLVPWFAVVAHLKVTQMHSIELLAMSDLFLHGVACGGIVGRIRIGLVGLL
jgi:hypothetical protein